MKPRSFLHCAGLGRIAYHLYHRPVGAVCDSWRAGGPWQQRRTDRGRAEMEAAALTIPPPVPATDPRPLAVHLLTGRRFWYQTAFCLWTFAHHAGRPLAPVIHDDGSLGPEHRAALLRLFPRLRFHGPEEIRACLDEHLPRDRFPALRGRADSLALLHKLLDPHVGSTGWKLLIDSDILFFRRPALLIDWIDLPCQPLHATDVQNAYGYPLELLGELAGRPVPECLNTGLLGLRSEAIDWERLEYTCAELQRRVGPHYFQEQALVAVLLASETCTAAPIADYVTLPRIPEARDCRAVMHHYVANSKRWYFQRNWRTALNIATR